MKCRNDWLGDAEPANQFFDALAHLRGGLVGEGHRQNGFRHYTLVFDQIGNAVGDDARFAAARPGKDQHRPVRSFHGLALLRVQLIEKRQCGRGSGSDDSILQGIEIRDAQREYNRHRLVAEYNQRSARSPMDIEDEAEQAEENGDLKTACILRKEIAAKKQNATSFFSYGCLAMRLEKWDEAEGAFAAALRLDPSFTLGMEGMGILWCERTDRNEVESFRTARDWYLKAIKLDRNARALTLLGCAYVALGDSTAAQTAFEDTLRHDPKYAEALYNLARRQEESNPARACE